MKTLKVGILGEPNTGKSTLFNTLIKKKHSIVTRKAQTTRKKTTAVLVKGDKQIIFTDTPGITTNKKNMNRGMFKEASNVLFEVDLVLLLFNIKKDNIENIKTSVEYFEKNQIDIVLVLNKVDLLSKANFYKRVSVIKDNFKNKKIFSISGKKNIGVDQFINYLILNERFTNDKPFIQKDLSTNLNYLTEIVREKVLENIHDEIPFNLRFVTDKVENNKDKSITVYITIFFKKISYKPIIIGRNGENIKKISMLARKDLEKNFNKKFHLFLFLKATKHNKNKGIKNDYLG